MFCELIIKAIPELVKYTLALELNFYFSKPQVKHMQAFILAMMMRGYCGKLTNVSEQILHTDHSCISRFLDSNSWNDAFLIRTLNAYVIKKIWDYSSKTNLPIYLIIDDTICEKTMPSSKAKKPIYGGSFHKSHLKNETVYGHQFVSAMLRCGDMVLPLAVVLYEKDVKSKIEIAKDIIESLPKPPSKGYVITDSWYSCTDLFKATCASGYHFIGAIKSNRKIFPRRFKRKGIKIGLYARTLHIRDFDIVTVNGRRYYMYTYLGKINGMHKVKIVITWPISSFRNPKTMKAFITTDIKMNGWRLLNHYSNRWPIEVFFREANRRFGMKKCQVRSKKAILRYQYLVMLAYTFCGLEARGNSLRFSEQFSAFRKNIDSFKVTWIVHQAQVGLSLNDILKQFRLT